MTQLLSSQGIDISQKNFQQIIIRGDGKDQFNEKINQEISTFPPSKNLEVTTNDKFIFAKNSFDQWSLIYLVEQDYKEILKFISKINSNDEILASDYSYGQVYFEISGENNILLICDKLDKENQVVNREKIETKIFSEKFNQLSNTYLTNLRKNINIKFFTK